MYWKRKNLSPLKQEDHLVNRNKIHLILVNLRKLTILSKPLEMEISWSLLLMMKNKTLIYLMRDKVIKIEMKIFLMCRSNLLPMLKILSFNCNYLPTEKVEVPH